jgi:ABC-type transport system involved in cytochrome bd biosynthesis fused ATPase/permease subunit
MFRWAIAVLTIAATALMLGLFEPALAVSDAQRLLLILLLLPLLRSAFWLTGFPAYGRAANHD